MLIYADHAATMPMRDCAVQAMLPYLQMNFGNPSSTHSAGQAAKKALENARQTVARALSCRAEGVCFTSGGTESDAQAIASAAAYGRSRGKMHLITTAIEHHAVLKPLRALQAEGFSLTVLPVGESGVLRAEQIAEALRPDTALVSVMMANNELGTLQPIAEISALCRQKGVLCHTDAVQAVGHIPLCFSELNVDYLSLSAHKFGGPKGIGALIARPDVPLSPLLLGGAQERGVRAGTENVAAICGMAAALAEACDHLPAEAAYVGALRDRLAEGLLRIPNAFCNGDLLQALPHMLNISFAGVSGEALAALLDAQSICVSTGAACNSGSEEGSPVLLAIGKGAALAASAIRFSLSARNTPDETAQMIAAVTDTVQRIRTLNETI